MIKQLLIAGCLTAGTIASTAQNTYVKQYFSTSGGSFLGAENRVKVQVIYDNKARTIDSVYGDFSNMVNIYQDKTDLRYIGTAHIGRASGADLLVRYDLDTYERIDSLATSGAQAIARNANKLLIAKGYGTNGANLDIYDARNLQLVTELSNINPASDVKIWGDSAFVANSLKSKINTCTVDYPCYADSIGYVSIVNLNTNAVVNVIELGTRAAGIDGLNIYKGEDSRIHIIYNNTLDSTERIIDNIVFHALKNTVVVEANGTDIYGISRTSPYLTALKINKLIADTLKITSLKKAGVWDGDTYAFDTVSNSFLFLRTDFGSYGKLYRFNLESKQITDSVSVGISSTDLAIDYRKGITTRIMAGHSPDGICVVYPNPFKDNLTINQICNWEILNIQGQKIVSGNTEESESKVNTENLLRGVYYLMLKSRDSKQIIQIIKE